ncbi:permease family-domain-containing protein [Fusarium tricinctum]|uniref:Permease family-domain-containing protein n=1 Tax=Fusarium tricinctum TaxID=61284 RepID=A0A8K0W6P8_9HYPO|nr:permease family-domain-containing protein [Fusarium tricinctum]
MRNRTADLDARFNRRVATSFIGRFFRLEGSGHPNEIAGSTFLNELRAGATTFAAMTYIIAVNASILSQTGGPCVCDEKNRINCDKIDSYAICKEEVRRDLIMATSAIAALSSILFGLSTNLPIALAPGMGLNAYFAFQVVGYNGSGSIPYGVALTAIFIEGLVFVFLALTGMRQWLVKLIPSTIKSATGAGIGLFLTEIGLSYGTGIGAITGGWNATPLSIAGCPIEMIDPETEMCSGGLMSSPKMWTAISAGLLLTAYLMAFRVRYAFVIGIALVSILSWPRGTAITYFPNTPEGDSRFDWFREITSFRPMKHTLNALDWKIGQHGTQFALALFTFLYVDIIDATATMCSMVRFCGVVENTDGDFPRSTIAYCCDAISISISALFGCSPVTAFIESGAGIAAGGCTGLTAMTTGLFFLLAVVFGPIFSSVPPWATGPALILVGCMMTRQITEINWRYIGDTLPSFAVIAFVPFSYSVAYGIIAGMLLYTTINLLISLTVRISGGRIEPENYDMKEYWTWKAPGRKPWFVRVFRNISCSRKTVDEYHPETFHTSNGSDCEMVRVASYDEQKDDNTRVSISMPKQTLSRFSR